MILPHDLARFLNPKLKLRATFSNLENSSTILGCRSELFRQLLDSCGLARIFVVFRPFALTDIDGIVSTLKITRSPFVVDTNAPRVISIGDNEMPNSKDQTRSGDQELYAGLIRLHILHHASKGPVFGLWFIEELGRHGYKLSPGTLYALGAPIGYTGGEMNLTLTSEQRRK